MKQMVSTEIPVINGSGMAWGSGEVPRVLVVGPDLPHLGVAGSILLHRLFQGWPPESLLAVGPSVPASILKHSCRFLAYQPTLGRFGVLLWRILLVRVVQISAQWRCVAAPFVPWHGFGVAL